jgi:hypothetical protein
MVEKAFLVEPHQTAVTLVPHPSIMVVIGVGAFLLFVACCAAIKMRTERQSG